ncbi:amidohydrolase family protein [Bordetella genomosp. 13]|uniref:amidohydrolase family protein n=1 Tax=Bordetella genomosp. 13 TaxID=463040 RepID=UPI0011A26C1A|nr:amidohydrolase family protein [Bordetella genomosp. 13]
MSRPCLPPHDAVERVQFDVPARACDSHVHIFGPGDRYPLAAERSYTPPENPCERLLKHLDAIGFERGVIVTASAYGTDNRSMLDALAAHPGRLRGVAVADADTAADTLRTWRRAGVCGLRFNLYAVGGAKVYKNGVGLEALEALAPAMRELDMHAQIWIHAPDLTDLAPRLDKLEVPLVVDHMGRMNASLGTGDPGFQQLCRMLASGRAWTKISGADRNTNQRDDYRDIDPYVRALIAANPERIVWGTDWPHINYFEAGAVPNDGTLLNTLYRWLPDSGLRNRILVDNPARLYRF